jgi:hypothetical protein
LPSGSPLHTHLANLDNNGNGVSTVDAGHLHKVSSMKVQPASSDAHVHEIVSA